jgi:hypothetical protein
VGDLTGHAERGDGEQSLYRFDRVPCMLSTSACLVGATCTVLIQRVAVRPIWRPSAVYCRRHTAFHALTCLSRLAESTAQLHAPQGSHPDECYYW